MRKLPILIANSVLAFAVFAEEGVSTQGQCHKKVTPDRGQITASAEDVSQNAKDARNKAATKIEKFRNAVKKLNLPDLELESTEASLYPQQEWENNKNVLKGFRANYSLRVSSSSFERMGEVLDAAINSGIKNAGQLSAFMSQELIKKEQKSCLEKATLDAREKAEILANSLGAKLGPVTRILHAPESPQNYRPMMAMEKATTSADSSPTLEAGKQDINVNVEVTFSLKK